MLNYRNSRTCHANWTCRQLQLMHHNEGRAHLCRCKTYEGYICANVKVIKDKCKTGKKKTYFFIALCWEVTMLLCEMELHLKMTNQRQTFPKILLLMRERRELDRYKNPIHTVYRSLQLAYRRFPCNWSKTSCVGKNNKKAPTIL